MAPPLPVMEERGYSTNFTLPEVGSRRRLP